MAEVHLATVDDGRHEANDAGQRNANEQDLEKASIERELWASRRARGCELQHSFLAEPRSAVSAKAWVTLVKKCQTTVPVATRVTALESCTKLLLHDTQPQGIPPWCSSIKSTPETLCRVSEQMRQWLVHLQGHNHTTVGWEAIGGEENDKIVGENPQLPGHVHTDILAASPCSK